MNKKLITYIGFAIAWIMVVILFIAITNQASLGLALLCYLPLVYGIFYIIFKVILHDRKKKVLQEEEKSYEEPITEPAQELSEVKDEHTSISDADKRLFIKLIGSTGLFLFINSLFQKNAANVILDGLSRSKGASFGGRGDFESRQTRDQSVDDYKIAEIEDDIITFFGYMNKDGAWYIVKADTEKGSFRYVRGDSDFASSWERRNELKYDYYSFVF